MPHSDETSDLRSYGRRRGRKPSKRQSSLLEDVLPRVAVHLAEPGSICVAAETLPVDASDVGQRVRSDRFRSAASALGVVADTDVNRDIWLEIGFGGGEHLVWQAKANPEILMVGCEPFEDGVVKVLSAICDDALENIRLHAGDARELLRALPAASIARAFILFPDPWPKRKHRKRRLINSATVALLARAMRPGAELRIATDIGDYARTILEVLAVEPAFAWKADGPDDWRVRPSDWPETRYEAKAAFAGRPRYYFRFFRNSAPVPLQGD